MGEPNLPDPIEDPGEDCLLCYLPGQTPRTVTMKVEGIDCKDVSMPINGEWVVRQDPADPCSYAEALYEGSYRRIFWHYTGEDGSALQIYDSKSNWFFYGFSYTPCMKVFTNQYTGGTGFGAGGIVTMIPNLKKPQNHIYSMYPLESAKYEVLLDTPAKRMDRVVNPRDKTNIKALRLKD